MGQVTEQLQGYFEKRGEHAIGALAYWSLSTVQIKRADFRAAMELIGLGGAVGRDPRPEALLSKAVERVKVGQRTCYFRRLGRYEHALLVEKHDGRVVRGEHLFTLRVKPDSTDAAWEWVGGATADDPMQSPAAVLANKTVEAYVQARDYIDTEDLSSFVVRALHGTYRDPMLAAVSLRETTGGLYFVPGGSLDKLRALAGYVRTCGSSNFTAFTLYADADNLAQAAEAAQRDFRQQLAETQAEVQGFLAELKADQGQATERNLEVRLRRFDALRARVDLWADVLGDTREGLLGTIEQAKAAMAAEMGL